MNIIGRGYYTLSVPDDNPIDCDKKFPADLGWMEEYLFLE